MKIFTIYSNSHSKLFEKFKDSLKGDWYRLIARDAPQLCTGDYGSEGSVDFWKLNIEYFLDICEKEKEPFLYLDCDVIVRQDPTEDLQNKLKGKDLIGQLDKYVFFRPQICTGIMYIRPTDAIKRMFEWMLKNIYKYGNDQKAINRYLFYSRVKWGVLPKTYYSINFDNGNKVWDGGELTIKKRDYIMYHLNWTIGTENKLKLWSEIERAI